MDKTIEREFFRAFELGGVVNNCFDWISQKYDLGVKAFPNEPAPKPLPEEWQKFYDITLPEQILEEAEAFNDGVIMYVDSPLIDEITTNLDECQNRQQQDRYIYSLLKPFREFSDKYHPLGEIKRLRGGVKGVCGISDFQKDLELWESMPPNKKLYNVGGKPSGTPKEQAAACKEMIETYQYRIERAKYVAKRYIELTCASDWEENSVEWCLCNFVHIVRVYTDRLDALLLERGLNLLWYQQQSGIYLKEYRRTTDVDYYLGSVELAQKYIDEALPKLEQESPETANKADAEAFTLPVELATTEAKKLFQRAIEARLMSKTGSGYKWEKSKALCAYFADRASEYLELQKGEKKVSWKPFETLFCTKGLSGARNDYQKTGTLPIGRGLVDSLFD